jgi:hypothetical protein
MISSQDTKSNNRSNPVFDALKSQVQDQPVAPLLCKLLNADQTTRPKDETSCLPPYIRTRLLEGITWLRLFVTIRYHKLVVVLVSNKASG